MSFSNAAPILIFKTPWKWVQVYVLSVCVMQKWWSFYPYSLCVSFLAHRNDDPLGPKEKKKNESLSERSAKCTKSRVTQGGYRKDRAMSSKDWSREKAESHEEHHWEESKSVSTLFEISCCIWDSGFSGLHWSQNEIMSARITLSVNGGHGKNEGGMAGKNSFYRNNPHEGLSLQQ